LYKIFYKVVYHHIIYIYDFLVNLDDFLAVVCTEFHEIAVSTGYVPFKNNEKIDHFMLKLEKLR